MSISNLTGEESLNCLIHKYETNREYTELFLKHMLSNHRDNPCFDLYLESELGSLKRSRMFIESLCQQFKNNNLFLKRECLDIGCSAGSALIAFVETGAIRATGIEIHDGRYRTALVNINGCSDETKKKIQLLRADIQNENITDIGQFDTIFCIDVLEHVESPKQAIKQICRLLKNDPGAFAFIKVGNSQNIENVIHEPHYDLPGMSLLPHELAKTYYADCNTDDALEYEVYHWLSFYEYKNMFESFGKKCELYDKFVPDLSGMIHIEKESKRIPLAFREFSEKHHLDFHLCEEIHQKINQYMERMQCLISEFRSTKESRLLEMFYLNYVVHDFNMIVTNER